MSNPPSGRVTSVRLNTEDREAIARIQQRGGFKTKGAVLKAALHYTDMQMEKALT